MPSFIINESGVVVGVMSFDPVAPEQHLLERYDVSVIGKRFENGEFVEVEPVQNDGDLVAHDGGALDG
ncbi:hypothetical protein ABMX69_06885 [Vibrio vulnificus]|uniref:hypothetical protein n=1 Tax=Vibrio vulnificus TaxID=672 RepID=UPI0005F0D072|nr:hypothetical protein [Vibrio vulnificus]EHT4939533.1 hypothetical protein [Vibrio vulnificus]